MTVTGTRLGRLLHYLLLGLLAIVGLALLAGIVALAITLFAPGLWPDDATVRGAGGITRPLIAQEDRALACLFLVLGCALGIAVLVPLVGLMRSAAAATPFVQANVGRLRQIAGVFAAIAVARIVLPLVLPPDTARLFGLEGPTLDLGPVLMALTVVVLAEVFAEGVRLREDAEGTV
jgi:hypothetical protein